jgi:hypothetical protein
MRDQHVVEVFRTIRAFDVGWANRSAAWIMMKAGLVIKSAAFRMR